MNGDLRGFQFALQPIHNKESWKSEKIQRQIAQKQKEINALKQEFEALEQSLGSAHEFLSSTLKASISAHHYQQHLKWLLNIRSQMAQRSKEILHAQAQKRDLVALLNQCQALIEVLDEHKKDCQTTYLRSAQSREAALADQEWLGKRYVK